MAVVAGGLMAACRQESGPVVERLPDPVYREYTPSPLPPVVPTPQASAPAIPSDPGWLPERGLSERWECIVIHHTASLAGSLRDVDAWHQAKGWESCGYHFVIGNGTNSPDGKVEPSVRWKEQSTGAHTRLGMNVRLGVENYYNEHGIGIVLVGDFERQRPSPRQMDSLVRLVRFLRTACRVPDSRIYVHGELKATDCPGRGFSPEEFRGRLKQR